jgi:SAM-dependent methyltransferase
MGLNELAKSMTVADWTRFILNSADETLADARAPKLPAADIQKLTNNTHGLVSLKGAGTMYVLVARVVGNRLGANADLRILDFGCGWGRFARFFPQLTAEENIFGVDVDDRLIRACEECLPRMNFCVIEPRKPMPFADGQFDVVFCNSVFSHLNEPAQRFCIDEIGRCTKAGGLLIATTMGPRNLKRMYEFQEKWLTDVLGPRDAAEKHLNAGKFLFGTTNRWPDYGLAFVPDNWTRDNWSPLFEIADVDTSLSEDVNIAVKTAARGDR